MSRRLLTRDEFREAVFARDGHRCVICGEVGTLDAHHIIERRLWPDGGYFVDNGVSLCPTHHLRAEETLLSCEELRAAAGIGTLLLPEHLEASERYDKWGNPILSTGQRLRGEMFWEEPVQKILAAGGVLELFTPYVKYPRTYHLPTSPGRSDDDKTHPDPGLFEGREVVVTCKMDGESASLYSDGYFHARSLSGRSHPSQAWIKALAATISSNIPEGWRVCGENLFARHSIAYENLPSFFMMFAIYDERNMCLSWDETVEWAGLLDLEVVPMIWRGEYDAEAVQRAFNDYAASTPGEHEGYVVRLADGFPYSSHRSSTGKWVRPGHVLDTGQHWASTQVVPNHLADDAQR